MSVSNLLDTRTVDFQELVGNGRTYKVPLYQRDYSWTEEQWEDLWLDIMEVSQSQIGRHYMGAIVVKAESDRSFLIIDGQQRIATLTILALAVIKTLTEHNESVEASENLQRAQALRSRFIGEKDPASLVEISKLSLNTHDNGFFADYLVQLRAPLSPRSLVKSNRLLWDCFEYFERKIKSETELSHNGLRLAELLSEVVARRLMFILIRVDDEISAYTVFETLNARGLELTTTDLLKNYLFSRLRTPSDLESAQRRWQQLVGTVRQERFGEFLRYHYLTRYRKIRSGRLFKLVRDEVKDAQAVLDLLTALEQRAELFEALGDPNHALWVDRPGARAYIAELVLFRVRQMTPLLFAAFECLSAEEFDKVLKLVSIVSFRYTVISGLNTNDLEPVYHDSARAVLDRTASNAGQVFRSLGPIYVSDEKFRADFSQKAIATSGPRKKVVKYLLCCLEQDVSGVPHNWETDPATIEHILPENPNQDWSDSIERRHWDDAIYRLGNMTLLESAKNRDAGGKTFNHKRDIYEDSQYKLSQQVADAASGEWTLRLIEERQKRMAQRAVHVWRCDFSDGSR